MCHNTTHSSLLYNLQNNSLYMNLNKSFGKCQRKTKNNCLHNLLCMNPSNYFCMHQNIFPYNLLYRFLCIHNNFGCTRLYNLAYYIP